MLSSPKLTSYIPVAIPKVLDLHCFLQLYFCRVATAVTAEVRAVQKNASSVVWKCIEMCLLFGEFSFSCRCSNRCHMSGFHYNTPLGNYLAWFWSSVCIMNNVPSKLRRCAAAQLLKCSRAHWIVAAQLVFFSFCCKYSYYAYYKKLLKWRAVVRSCKSFLLRAVAGSRSCKKKLEGTLITSKVSG
jgi:hypothetical protein